ncbi:hypothetical protein DSM104443_01680 [Usitatibacter rugosus]|uniref:Uncharacterized protein n=1 Tax=Usitatibacter rugosus TaxID=2732067 RepID=A0A6M4GTZ7_9PROT|nr:hypothetical protein [Usitatibacter rugosus]QJR10616.1 hypothetical protein DSM104443_01680 [Usitatibacter rugosus]
MRNPAHRIIGFGAAAFMFVLVFAFTMKGEAQRQVVAKRDQQAQIQQQRLRARAPVRYAAPAVEEDWRSPQDYDSVRYQPDSRSYDSDYRDVASQRSYYEPRAVVVEADDRYERAVEQRRTDAEADRLTRQLDARLYER